MQNCFSEFYICPRISEIKTSKHPSWLDLTDTKLSTLQFLHFTPNLEILNLSGCKNLRDTDFIVIADCIKLDQLYLSFTNISPTVLVKLAKSLDLISLDACAVALSLNECKTIIENLKNLTFFHLSPKDISNSEFDQEVRHVYQDCCFS